MIVAQRDMTWGLTSPAAMRLMTSSCNRRMDFGSDIDFSVSRRDATDPGITLIHSRDALRRNLRLGRDYLSYNLSLFSLPPTTTMTTTDPSNIHIQPLAADRTVFPSSPDKYRGAVVEVRACVRACVCPPSSGRHTHPPASHSLTHSPFIIYSQDLQFPPAFCLPRSELIGRAIELAYDRDFSHIPCVCVYLSPPLAPNSPTPPNQTGSLASAAIS